MLNIDDLRSSLIRQEETIIFSLIERAQFKQNLLIYEHDGIQIPDYHGSFSDYLLKETEKIHAKVRRYSSPDEYSFFSDLPTPILPPLQYSHAVNQKECNFNGKIHEFYQNDIIPIICSEGDDENYGSSATCDVVCLQSLSKRIHYGTFVAEVKYQEDKRTYAQLIRSGDSDKILEKLTFKEIEEQLLSRVQQKAATYGQDLYSNGGKSNFKIDPVTIRDIYEKWIIPLTKEVELCYLMRRLNE